MGSSHNNPIKDLKSLGDAWKGLLQPARPEPGAVELPSNRSSDRVGADSSPPPTQPGQREADPESVVAEPGTGAAVDGRLQDALAASAAQCARLDAELTGTRETLAQQHKELEELAAHNARLTEQIAFHRRKEEAWGVLQDRARKILDDERRLEQDRLAFESDLDALDTLKRRESTVSQREAELAADSQRLADRSLLVVDAEQRIALAQAEAQAASARAERAKQAVARHAKVAATAQQDAELLRSQLAAVKREKSKLARDCAAEQETSEGLRQTVAKLESAVESERTEVSRLAEQLAKSPQFAVQDETLLRWLLGDGTPKSLGMRNRYLGWTGSGPYPDDVLTAALQGLRFEPSQLPHEDIGYVIVGRDGWSDVELLDQIALRQGKSLRIYSEEMLVVALATGRDPLDSGDEDLLRAFASGHPALEFLMEQDFEWPAVDVPDTKVIKPLSDRDLGVTESPLHLLGYHVGATSDLSVSERREILREVFETQELPFVDSAEYMEKWGRRLGHQRLWRMATHLQHLINGPVGRDYRKPQTRRDWISDLKWLQSEFYARRRFRFRWPETRVGA